VAENYMLEDLLVPAYREAIEQNLFQADRIYYQPTQGRADMRQALCQHYVPEILNGIQLKEENLIVGAGCNAVLENLAISLADSGEGVMIPVPYYAAFEFDLVARADLQIIPVEPTPDLVMTRSNTEVKDTLSAAAYYPTADSLSLAYAQSVEAGITPKILLLSHPNNPLGVNYPRSVLEECLDWALEHNIHIISDEIYAGSVYKATGTTSETDGTEFVSMMQVASERKLGPTDDGKIGIGNMVHWVYAISKDFCSSGLRVGLSYTENDEILLPVSKLNDMCQVSSQTQALVQHTFGKPGFVGSFLEEAQSRLQTRSAKVHAKCQELGVPTLHSEAGMFLWVDLSEFMIEKLDSTESVEEQERALYKELIQHGLLLTPGTSMKMPFPGVFRFVYTAVKTEEEVDLGLQRLENFVQANRKP
jgi:1-aminocyclopropane-1-carboxylate synthase